MNCPSPIAWAQSWLQEGAIEPYLKQKHCALSMGGAAGVPIGLSSGLSLVYCDSLVSKFMGQHLTSRANTMHPWGQGVLSALFVFAVVGEAVVGGTPSSRWCSPLAWLVPGGSSPGAVHWQVVVVLGCYEAWRQVAPCSSLYQEALP